MGITYQKERRGSVNSYVIMASSLPHN